MEQREFLQRMDELVEYGRVKENLLTQSEVADYCSDFHMSKEQLELVYAYLREHQIFVEGFQGGAISEKQENPEDSRYLRMYLEELKNLDLYGEEEKAILYSRLRSGEKEAVPAVIENNLNLVMMLAEEYRGRGVLMEDLIQEGNLELTACASMLCGNREVPDYENAIEFAVRSRMIELVDEEVSGSDSISMVLARVNLLLEATRTLAEQYGRVATLEELSEFTHMDKEEIRMYVDLSRDEIELGKGEKSGK